MARREQYSREIARNGGGNVISLTVAAVDLEGSGRHVTVRGARAVDATSALRELLRDRRITGRAWTSPEPIALDQVTGAQTELLLRAVAPLRRTDRAYILETGEITKTGTGAELLADPAVKHAYLGVG